MARPTNRADRRAQIVAGLRVVLAEVGYERASIVAIARAARLTPGLLHYHFVRKQDILVALVEELESVVCAREAALLASAPDTPRARLGALLDAHLAPGPGADGEALAAWVAVGSEAAHLPEVREVYAAAMERTRARLHAAILACLEAEQRSAHAAPALTAACLVFLEGSARLGVAAPSVLPAGFAAPTLRALLDAGIAAAPAAC
ncbi:MAG: TetR family transcriptional regulator C-terminal domain-containing protein [Pseudomonadota bacterium]|nr:TetR family transcriptional regulator C-terminal domain-containing protein [Pseudomonadota bacterium]